MCFNETSTKQDGTSPIPAGLLAQVPRDQALGLRLIALARAAAALHMAQLSPDGGAEVGTVLPESGER